MKAALTKVFQGEQIRVIGGDVGHFVIADVARALGYDQASDLKRLITDKYVVKQNVRDQRGSVQEHACASEPGLWQVLARIRKDAAEPFQDWLYEEVLPTIRKTGGYNAGTSDPGGLTDRASTVAQEVKELQNEIGRRQARLDEAKSELHALMPGQGDGCQGGAPELAEHSTTNRMTEADRLDEPGLQGGGLTLTDPSKHTRAEATFRLERPLALVDLETTGTDPASDKITQIALYRLVPSEEGPKAAGSVVTYVDPERPIPEEAAEVSGITQADVENAPVFGGIADDVASLVADADLMGYNAAAFDLDFLKEAFSRVGRKMPRPPGSVTVDPYLLERAMRSNKLTDVYKRYTGETLEDAHDADADIRATWSVLMHQLAGLPLDGAVDAHDVAECARGDFLDDKQNFRRDGSRVLVCFGKHKGRALRDVQQAEPSYIDWMLDQDDMAPYVKKHLEA